MIPIVLEDEPSIGLLRTLEIEVSDGGEILVTDECDDGQRFRTVQMEIPVEHAERFAMAILRAAREAREQRALPLTLPIGLPAPGPVGVGR